MYDFVTNPVSSAKSSYKYKDMYDRNPDVPEGIVPLSIADMEFIIAPEIREGIGKYLADRTLGYTFASEEYYEAVIEWMQKRHSYHLEKEWIAPSDGVVTALGDLILSVTKPGDGVIVFSPSYRPFRIAVDVKNRKLVDIPLIFDEDGYRIDFDAFEEAAKETANTLLIFCNPHNPVGRVWTKEELQRVCDICLANGVFIIDDEIHNDLIMPGITHTVMSTVSEEASMNMAVCTAPSKTFNLSALQTSNIIIRNPDVRDRFVSSRLDGFRSGTNAIGMEACRIAYSSCEKWLDECIAVIASNAMYVKDFFAKNMPEIKALPLEGTYLLWCDFRAWRLSDKELEDFMVKKAYIFADEGYVFGSSGSGFERLNLACPENVIRDTMERLLRARNKYIYK